MLLPATIKVSSTPKKVKVDKTRVKLRIVVTARQVQPTGWVTVKVPGQARITVKLVRGRATVTLPRFTSTGTQEVTVTYRGDDTVAETTRTYDIRVVR